MLLAFDVGIKHLAYCVMNHQGHIHHWSLVNLTQENQEKQVCVTCQKPAKASSPIGLVCGRHMGDIRLEVDKKLIPKPTVAQLKSFLEEQKLDTKGKREELLERVTSVATVALPKQRNAMSFAENTSRLHDAIRDWIIRDWQYLAQVTHVYIEHQPVLKNPVMKTVQITLFVALRERYLTHGLNALFYLVHASKKVKAVAGDDGYKDRKKGSIERARVYLETHPQWRVWWEGQSKKDDVSDALCMVLDKL
jgi:hypothetical protein